jgi:drug/metabolite transporter (DMT)-like permease
VPALPKGDLARKTCFLIFTLGSVAYLSFFLACEYISLSQVVVLMQTAGLWAPILGFLILRQETGVLKIVLSIVSFVGIIMVVDPRIIGLGYSMPTAVKEVGSAYSRNLFGCGIGLLSGFLIAYKRVITIAGKDSIHI